MKRKFNPEMVSFQGEKITSPEEIIVRVCIKAKMPQR